MKRRKEVEWSALGDGAGWVRGQNAAAAEEEEREDGRMGQGLATEDGSERIKRE